MMAGTRPGGTASGAKRYRQRRARTKSPSGASTTPKATHSQRVRRSWARSSARSTLQKRYAQSPRLTAIPRTARRLSARLAFHADHRGRGRDDGQPIDRAERPAHVPLARLVRHHDDGHRLAQRAALLDDGLDRDVVLAQDAGRSEE